MPFRPMNGSVSSPMNRLIALNVVCCDPVATSPEICVSALASAPPESPNRFTKAGGRLPPALKALLMLFATFCWLPFNPPLPPPRLATRFRKTSCAS